MAGKRYRKGALHSPLGNNHKMGDEKKHPLVVWQGTVQGPDNNTIQLIVV